MHPSSLTSISERLLQLTVIYIATLMIFDRFLEKAAVQVKPPAATEGNMGKFSKEAINPWKLCPASQVEGVKQVVRLLPVWLILAPAGAVSAQMVTFYTLQGQTLDTHMMMWGSVHVPPASLQCIATATLLLSLPLYDRLVVPFFRRLTGSQHGVSHLQRIGVGLFLSVLVMVVAAVVEARRLKVTSCN